MSVAGEPERTEDARSEDGRNNGRKEKSMVAATAAKEVAEEETRIGESACMLPESVIGRQVSAAYEEYRLQIPMSNSGSVKVEQRRKAARCVEQLRTGSTELCGVLKAIRYELSARTEEVHQLRKFIALKEEAARANRVNPAPVALANVVPPSRTAPGKADGKTRKVAAVVVPVDVPMEVAQAGVAPAGVAPAGVTSAAVIPVEGAAAEDRDGEWTKVVGRRAYSEMAARPKPREKVFSLRVGPTKGSMTSEETKKRLRQVVDPAKSGIAVAGVTKVRGGAVVVTCPRKEDIE